MTSRPHGIDGWGYPNQEYAPEPRVMTEAPRSALVVTPHPDDAEGGCGATMAKWVAESGTRVVILMCTNGNKAPATVRSRPPWPQRVRSTSKTPPKC